VKTDFYDIQKVYEKKLISEMELKYTPVEDTKNSYKLGAGTMGPGHDPVQPNDLDASQFKDTVMFPRGGEITNEMKRKMLIQFLDEEIVEGTWDEEIKEAFAKLLYVLL
jgi:hypothetical protein